MLQLINLTNPQNTIMKNFIFLFILGFSFLTNNLLASTSANITSAADTRCTWDSWFQYPKSHSKFDFGKDVYVLVNARKYHDIAYMKLFINGKFIRKEINSPYEWGRPHSNGDNILRNLRPGTYTLKVIIKDRCGYQHEKQCVIYVNHKGNGGNNYCHFNNPIKDFNWLSQLHRKFPNYYICQYKKNGKVLFRIYRPNVNNCYEYWYDCTGRFICKFYTGHPGPSSISRCDFVKCWFKCGTPPPPKHCKFKFWFKHPIKQEFKKGEGFYVNVAADNPSDIKFMELFVNGRSLGKEMNAPYEWGKQNTSSYNFFRNLHEGTYKLLVIVHDRCGRTYKKYCTIVIKKCITYEQHCNFKFWFKNPIKTCRSGRDIFITVDTDNYKDIDFMELYVNGRFIRKETRAPYEWAKPGAGGDYQLRNCRPGTYKILVRVKSKCGKWYEKYCVVTVNRGNA